MPEFFIPRQSPVNAGAAIVYQPTLLGVARLHYVDKKAGIDYWETLGLHQLVGEKIAY